MKEWDEKLLIAYNMVVVAAVRDIAISSSSSSSSSSGAGLAQAV
jgi:hypothetical protein